MLLENAEKITEDITQKVADRFADFPWAVAIICIAAFIAIIVILIRGLKAKNGETKKPKDIGVGFGIRRAGSTYGAFDATAKYVLVCESGYLEGRRYSLTNRLTIGHNPERCNVCYPNNAGGISSEHCEVRLNASEQCELVDLGSMSGTYLENGRKLMPNVPTILSPGGRFYIATPGEMFRIEKR